MSLSNGNGIGNIVRSIDFSCKKEYNYECKLFDELQLGTDFVSRQFAYHAGKITEEHKTNAKVKSSATTQLVSQIILSNGTTLSYGYDAEERITSVVETYTVDGTPVTNTTLYTYDALGQLLTETVNGEVVNTMKYDNYGNIVEKNGKAYIYGDATWKDLLTGFDGKTIKYDAQGNPTSYLGHTLTLEKGRQLKKFDSIEYTYNAKGIRTGKKVNGVLHTYTLDGTKILRETWGENTLVPLYDNEDSICGILYSSVPYYFIKNLQGDVIAIVDKDAKAVARYTYDAWGVPTIKEDTSGCNIATVNPFRYRGYFYDAETKLYYLQSRYYDPEVERFINADKVNFVSHKMNILCCNLMAYCLNEPISQIDLSGTAPNYINDQADQRWGHLRVGFWGNVKDNGCGAIALYNVFTTYSNKITLTKVLSDLRWKYGASIYNNIGKIGIAPESITSYLSSNFFFLYTAGAVWQLWKIKANWSGAIIVLYKHPSRGLYLHYVAGIKTSNGLFRFYNDYYYDKAYSRKQPISLQKYIDLLKANGCHMVAFWGVAKKKGWW